MGSPLKIMPKTARQAPKSAAHDAPEEARGSRLGDETLITHLGRDPLANFGVVNPPVYHASTILHPNTESFASSFQRRFEKGEVNYGRMGTPTSYALEDAVAQLEGGYGATSVSSGLAAITTAILAFVKAGDHILMTDSAYMPSQSFSRGMLARLGVETTFYPPCITADDLSALVRKNTRILFTESPGSITFEMQDIPALSAAAKAVNPDLVVLTDNTWATPLYYKALAHGVDVSIHAGTKYIGGHSDVMIGLITTTEQHYVTVRQSATSLGIASGPDDIYLALRGLRTMAVRLRRHQETGLTLARWLEARPEVARVLHPALPGDPGHAIWRRDYTGACGLFGVELVPAPDQAVAAMVDDLELFGIGASWGGYESLAMPIEPRKLHREAESWTGAGPLVRFHAGLEDPDDLIADLEAGLARFNRVRKAS